MLELSELRRKNLELAKKRFKESVNTDLLIINAINNFEELQKIINTLTKKLREWYSLYFPELDREVQDNEAFVRLVIKKNKKELLNELGLKESIGAELNKEDLEPIISLARLINNLIKEKHLLEEYLERTMRSYCPETSTISGALIGAKLLRGAGSLKKLAMMRSSTIQLLGAEKALFRHIRTGAKPPKYGYLMQHPLVQNAKKKDKGRVARALADKIFICARVDYFKGAPIAARLLDELEEKFKKKSSTE